MSNNTLPQTSPFREVAQKTAWKAEDQKPKPILVTDHELLHKLWTKAVGTADYNKQEWKELEARFLRGRRGVS